MLLWLLDGSALLVGSALFDPSTGAWTALELPAGAAVAAGSAGRFAVLERAEGAAPRLSVWQGAAPGPAVTLAEVPADWTLAHALEGDRVYLHASDPQSGEARCWWVEGEAVSAPGSCLEGGFAALDAITPAGGGAWVVSSHGEGHPDVSLVRWAGEGSEAAALPWQDLYPFGPLSMLPRVDGSFDLLTPCALGPPRPCLQEDGTGAEALPARWYRWTPGEAPRLLGQGRAAEGAPDPASERVATLRGRRLCLGAPDERPACHRLPP